MAQKATVGLNHGRAVSALLDWASEDPGRRRFDIKYNGPVWIKPTSWRGGFGVRLYSSRKGGWLPEQQGQTLLQAARSAVQNYHKPRKQERPGAFKVHGRPVSKGEHLRDDTGVLCRVERVGTDLLLTRVRQNGEYWIGKSCAEWTPVQFASRRWKRAHPRPFKKTEGVAE